jgi:hypothetical protein
MVEKLNSQGWGYVIKQLRRWKKPHPSLGRTMVGGRSEDQL